MQREIDAITWPMGTHQAADWLRARVASLGGALQPWRGADKGQPPPPDWLAPMFARAVCALWWRRQLRRAVVRAREDEGRAKGEICQRAGQVYCTNDTLQRRAQRSAENAAMLEATKIEDATGQTITLAQAAAASTSCKPIRRGELMTRIKGCEDAATAAGLVGIFTTNTLPSRFHPQTMHGGRNPRADGTDGPMQPGDPRAGQLAHRTTWARCRAKLARMGLRFFGFRVAEPHHDGCPHWHMLLWCAPADAAALQATMRAAWLAESPDQPGASEHRFKAMVMEPGGAVAYMAKYIAKGIDDAGSIGTEGHKDTDHAGQSDWIGGKAARVEAWAAAHGLRQFQAIGQPPVTVWRELRRVADEAVQGAAPEVLAAHAAVQRKGERRACWRAYMDAQGGPMVGRAYGITIACSEDLPEKGRYGEDKPARIIGVEHVSRPGQLIASQRRQWKPAGTWRDDERQPAVIPGLGVGLRAFDLPRTRVNNCTVLAGRIMARGAPLRTWLQEIEARGALKAPNGKNQARPV